ncbi:hypothetical protein [Halorubrum ezzemoulense]|uniref:hypothetical protein n=1 Tax=Halorubrum ezzemoulense TaxID=337243 RepID=UPI00232FBD4E|nr:hypothetical protein [Halorubrum ezzemoulense]MDB2239331.1 hypothetical protein [Halorubrum ezzemoulense]
MTTARQRHCGAGEATGTAKTTATSTRGRRERLDGGGGAATSDTIQNHRSEEQLSTTVQQGTAIGRETSEARRGRWRWKVERKLDPPDCRRQIVQDGADVDDQGGARWRLGGGE